MIMNIIMMMIGTDINDINIKIQLQTGSISKQIKKKKQTNSDYDMYLCILIDI